MTDSKDFFAGQQINENFLVLSVQEKTTKDGNPYFSANIANKSGKYTARVFSEAIPHSPLKECAVFSIQGRIQNYNGSLSILVDSANEDKDEKAADYLPEIPTLVFDIETVGLPFDKLDKDDQEYLLGTLENNSEESIAKERTGLHPIYGFVAFIGMENPDSGKGTVIGLSGEKIKPKNKMFNFIECKDEKELLEKFWKIAQKYELFVTYNGKKFDVPFLLFRSLANRVQIPININNQSKHIDLMAAIRPFGSKAYKLESICKSLKITNPKEEGVSGLHVSELFKKKKYKDIVDYVVRDAKSTTELYRLWKNAAPFNF